METRAAAGIQQWAARRGPGKPRRCGLEPGGRGGGGRGARARLQVGRARGPTVSGRPLASRPGQPKCPQDSKTHVVGSPWCHIVDITASGEGSGPPKDPPLYGQERGLSSALLVGTQFGGALNPPTRASHLGSSGSERHTLISPPNSVPVTLYRCKPKPVRSGPETKPITWREST